MGRLDQREAAADIEPRRPILIDPEHRIDPVLARFLARSRFTWLADGTREAYAKDYRLFFSFLWQRGKYWHEADPDDLLDWESWRRRGQPGRRISGNKWQRELAALRLMHPDGRAVAVGCLRWLAQVRAGRGLPGLSLDDELFSPDAYHLADRWLERIRGDGVVPEIGQPGGTVAESHLVVEQAGGGGNELE